ncbi:MAG TPA: hypothetical protein VGL56_02115 [Fimbriimonadaceae bacterium]
MFANAVLLLLASGNRASGRAWKDLVGVTNFNTLTYSNPNSEDAKINAFATKYLLKRGVSVNIPSKGPDPMPPGRSGISFPPPILRVHEQLTEHNCDFGIVLEAHLPLSEHFTTFAKADKEKYKPFDQPRLWQRSFSISDHDHVRLLKKAQVLIDKDLAEFVSDWKRAHR